MARPEDMPGYTPADWQYWSYLGGGSAVLAEHKRLVREALLTALGIVSLHDKDQATTEIKKLIEKQSQ